MDTPIVEALLVTMFVESFGDRSIARFGAAVSAPLTIDDFTWKSVTARFLKEDVLQQVSKSANSLTEDQALGSCTQKGKKKKKKKNYSGSDCSYCGKLGYFQADCFMRKREMANFDESKCTPGKAMVT